MSQVFNLSPVTPIVCIQLPVEVLGKRKIGEPEYTRLMSQKGVVGWVKENVTSHRLQVASISAYGTWSTSLSSIEKEVEALLHR